MFDKEKLRKVLEAYKRDFYPYLWEEEYKGEKYDGEKFKWIAVKTFQDNWNINAADFPDMLERSLKETHGLLNGMGKFPKAMILGFARSASEKIRSMFLSLFDESKNLAERIAEFKEKSQEMLAQYGNGAKSHFQDENVITTYLWLRYPDKYYIYRLGESQTACRVLDSNYEFRKGAYAQNLRNYLNFYDELCAYISKSTDVTDLLHRHLTDDCYSDKEYRTLTFDICFYIKHYYSEGQTAKEKYEHKRVWFPHDYSPEITTDTWVELLHDSGVFTDGSLQIMKRLKDFGGQATCSQLAAKYGETPNFYNSGSVALARRVADRTGCPVLTTDDGDIKYWPVLYVGRGADKDNEGVFIWKLRDELAAALDRYDLSGVDLFGDAADDSNVRHRQPGENASAAEHSAGKYSKEDFLNQVFMSEQRYDILVAVLKNKKNVILQGAPGVGKTFAAKRLAYSIMGEKDDTRIEFIQFHQNYSYEDFIMGYKPSGDGFELKTGIFYRFCQKAAEQPDKEFFFIIDEINRGNMSKIFGELLMLIEKDYRGTKATLAYNGISFSVPENLYIIGMMNTADRSLAMIDYALRRRFSFFEMEPGFDSDGFIRYQSEMNDETFNQLIEKIKELNKEISSDRSLGKGFCIGHSYFSNWSDCTEEKMHAVVDFDILPMLGEYWFDDTATLQRWSNILHGVFQ